MAIPECLDATQRAAFGSGYDTVLRSFVQQTIAFVVAGIILAVVGVVLAWQRDRNRRPTGWAQPFPRAGR